MTHLECRPANGAGNPSRPWWHSCFSRLALVAVGLTLVCGASSIAAERHVAGDTFASEGPVVRRVVVTVNKSQTYEVGKKFSRAIVGSADFADVLPLSEHSIYIQGKKAGTTNVSLFGEDAKIIAILDLSITPDTTDLQQKIRASTGSQSIRVSSVQNQVVLSGVAGNSVAAERAVQVAKSLVGDQGVVNAMEVAPTQQVMLEVRFLEATRDASRELGVNWFQGNHNGTRGINTGIQRGLAVAPAPGTADPAAGGGIPLVGTLGTLATPSLGAPAFTALVNLINKNGNTLDVLVTALEEKGVVRRLAEPNLVALSGDEASFLAGGEFPVPVASTTQNGIPTITIQFKKFGVQLRFTPTVLTRGVVNLRIEPEVSELDFTNAVTISGTTIPALTTRNAKTTLEMRDGQSFAIAGLLSGINTNNMSQVPWLGTVPVLGTLFRSTSYQQKETDLVIIVTPRLVAPAVPGQRLATPLDSRLPGNDVDSFLLGQQEVKKEYSDYVANGVGIKGPYGHIIQPELAQPKVNKQ
ncbi:type II and III secretion system protein family protein [Bradyrhizobium erythrophlei]|uniref:type II and III secretion system protein family protein n=1 Tax=Bradyrhizobium erythrophlei TaxID=1437360 RepID=UPI0035EF9A29